MKYKYYFQRAYVLFCLSVYLYLFILSLFLSPSHYLIPFLFLYLLGSLLHTTLHLSISLISLLISSKLSLLKYPSPNPSSLKKAKIQTLHKEIWLLVLGWE